MQLARPGYANQAKGPIVVRCGNTACSFLLSVPPGSGNRFCCPKCNVVQLLPEDPTNALKNRAAQEEDKRQQEARNKHKLTLQELVENFGNLGIESQVIEAVYDNSNSDRS